MRKSIIVTLVLLAALSYCASAGTQLGSLEPAKMKVISQEGSSANASKNINSGVESRDVTKLANIPSIFGVAANAVNITGVNATGEQWIEISNLGAASNNLTGWILKNQENFTYTFPALILDSGSKVKVHGGMGSNSNTDLYANASQPLVNENADVITLLNANGAVEGRYSFNTSAQASTPSSRSPEKMPILVSGNGLGFSKNPDTAPILLNGNSTRDPEKQSILINDTSGRDPEKTPLLINVSSSSKANVPA